MSVCAKWHSIGGREGGNGIEDGVLYWVKEVENPIKKASNHTSRRAEGGRVLLVESKKRQRERGTWTRNKIKEAKTFFFPKKRGGGEEGKNRK